MGIIRLGPPEGLVLALRDSLGAKVFIETGTYRGGTAEWACRHFADVQSIEWSEAIYRETKARIGGLPNLTLHCGDTREILPQLVQALDKPAVMWLDAHWSGKATAGISDQCPLLEELTIIDRAGPEVAMLIDDARFFLAPPPEPLNIDDWPDLGTVVQTLAKGRERYVAVTEDVIVAVPMRHRDVVVAHCRELATLALTQRRAFRRRLRKFGRKLFRRRKDQ